MTVLVVGAGRVGLVMAVALARLGHRVVGLEKDAERVELLRRGRSPFWEAGLQEALPEEMESGRLQFLHLDEQAGITGTAGMPGSSQIVMLCVGTPPASAGGVDLSQLEEAVDSLLPWLRGTNRKVVLVTKSTVPVGTARALAARIEAYGLSDRVLVASNPEFLREGTALEDALHPHRIVIGVREPEAAEILRELYAPVDAPTVVTDWQTAELSKYAANAFLATRLSFLNELADLAEAMGADVVQVAHCLGLDPRIGPHYLKAGLGYGGSCLPKDVAGLLHMAADLGIAPVLLGAVAAVNAARPGKAVARLRQALGGRLAGRVVAVLGLSFKGGTDDLRSSPALEVVRQLLQAGARVRAYDPAHAPAPDLARGLARAPAREPARELAIVKARAAIPDPGGSLAIFPEAYEAVRGAQAVAVLTDWAEFPQLDWARIRALMTGRVVLDARLCLDEARLAGLGFTYLAPGRGQFPASPREAGEHG
ncbi:MAG TPA: UDP-glucose/GDP-mannose dehydrogenase family protein [Firmicutes bacterium]|nr:UDP-glucose/GDP-mannose dehydrogenase family protein [Bacillota bacterium]